MCCTNIIIICIYLEERVIWKLFKVYLNSERIVLTVLIVQLSDHGCADVEVHHGLLDLFCQVVTKPCAIVGNSKFWLWSLIHNLELGFILVTAFSMALRVQCTTVDLADALFGDNRWRNYWHFCQIIVKF